MKQLTFALTDGLLRSILLFLTCNFLVSVYAQETYAIAVVTFFIIAYYSGSLLLFRKLDTDERPRFLVMSLVLFAILSFMMQLLSSFLGSASIFTVRETLDNDAFPVYAIYIVAFWSVSVAERLIFALVATKIKRKKQALEKDRQL